MKKFIENARFRVACAIFAVAVALSGCGEAKTICGKRIDTYGVLSENEKNENVQYHTVPGSVILGIVGIETVFIPVYTFGFDLYEPVNNKVPCEDFLPKHKS